MIPRGAEGRVHEALADRPVVTIVGPRQSGKSTLAQRVVRATRSMRYLTLDTATTLAAAAEDPEGFLSRLPGPIAIDEAQRAPGLFRAIKAEVDRDRSPGRFLLTGSADVLLLPSISESLAGRMEVLRLLPVSERERRRRKGNAVDALLDAGRLARAAPRPASRAEVIDRIVRGGFPEAQGIADERRRTEWFRSYEAALVHRDVRDVARIEDLTAVPRLLRLLAARTARVANLADLARDAHLSHMTARRYVGHLEALFLASHLPAWARSPSRKVAKAPKLVLVDSGLAAFLLHASSARIGEDGSLLGPLLETFAIDEIDRQRTWSERTPALLHYRTHAGREVDAVLEDREGRVAGIEVKAAASVVGEDFRGLRSLAEDAGRQFESGTVLYMGREVVPFGERLFAIPISFLWEDLPR